MQVSSLARTVLKPRHGSNLRDSTAEEYPGDNHLRPDDHNLVLFLGHFHPLLVHLPIGGLVLLGMLELLACHPRWRDAAQNSPWILGFVCVTAVVSGAFGYMLAQEGGYDAQILKWHQATGFAVVGAACLSWLLRVLDWRRSYRGCLFASIVLLAIASHLGGSMTHGGDFLTRYAPKAVRRILGQFVPESKADLSGPPMQQPVFEGIVEPILQQRCVACHGAEKHKAGLRLDTLDELLKGGQDGRVIAAGRAKDSPLIECMVSAVDADGHMPPEEQPQATSEEITLLVWWINDGAPDSTRVADLKPKPEIRRLLELVARRQEPARSKVNP